MAAERRVVHIEINASRAASQLKNMDRNLEKTRRSAQSLERSFNRLNTVLSAAMLATSVGYVIRSFIQLSDEYQELSGRVDIVARDTVGLTQALSDLNDTARLTFTSFDGTADLYARLGVATGHLGTTHEQLVDIVQLTADTLRLSGSNAKEASAFMTQFSQALASNRFAGDEFRSMLESNVYMSQLLAGALKTNIGGLRAMAEAGELTTDVMLNALLPAVDKVREEAANLPVTITRAWTNLESATQLLLGALASVDGQMSIIASTIQGLTWIVDTFREGVEVLASYTSPDDASRFNLLQTERLETLRKIAVTQGVLIEQGNDPNLFGTQLFSTISRLQVLYDGLNRVNTELDSMRSENERVARLAGGTPVGIGGEEDAGPDAAVETQVAAWSRLERASEERFQTWRDGLLSVRDAAVAAVDPNAALVAELEKLDGALIAMPDHADVFLERMFQIHEEMDKNITPSVEKTVEWTDTLAVAMGNTLANATNQAADAMVDFAVRGEGSFTDMAQSILESIAEMIIQFALMRALFGATGGSTGTGGLLGPLLNEATGDAFQGGNVVPFARGGVVNQPTLFPMANGAGLMGEAGPEAIMPLSRDRNGRLGVSGGGTVVNIQNNTGAETSVERSQGPDGQEMVDVIIGQVAGSIASGGPPAQAIEQAYGIRRAGYAR